jgi:hypothetical protein
VYKKQGTKNERLLMDRITWPKNSNAEISVEVINEGIAIRHTGKLGTTSCYDGDYAPIIIEWWDGVPRIIIWADINDQDPTHIIDMSKALESNRNETV